MSNYVDQEIQCADCGTSFVFNAEDQEFFQTKGYSAPKRCPQCRAARKANDRGGNRGGGGRSFGAKQQYRVICSECGVETTVPFEPRNDRPVFCSDCYRNHNS